MDKGNQHIQFYGSGLMISETKDTSGPYSAAIRYNLPVQDCRLEGEFFSPML